MIIITVIRLFWRGWRRVRINELWYLTRTFELEKESLTINSNTVASAVQAENKWGQPL